MFIVNWEICYKRTPFEKWIYYLLQVLGLKYNESMKYELVTLA